MHYALVALALYLPIVPVMPCADLTGVVLSGYTASSALLWIYGTDGVPAPLDVDWHARCGVPALALSASIA